MMFRIIKCTCLNKSWYIIEKKRLFRWKTIKSSSVDIHGGYWTDDVKFDSVHECINYIDTNFHKVKKEFITFVYLNR